MKTPAVANVVQRARYVTWRKMMSSNDERIADALELIAHLMLMQHKERNAGERATVS